MKASKPLTYLMLLITGLIGGGGLLIFMIFLIQGLYNIVDFGLTNIQILLFDIFLCFLFFAQHTLMARKPLRSGSRNAAGHHTFYT